MSFRPSSLLVQAITALFLVCAFSWQKAARADHLTATRGQRLVETRHTVSLDLRDGLAYYKVRRTFRNYGTVAEEARLTINLPYGAVATGLRIKGKDKWHKGELLHARKAEELYRELTGLGSSEPKDPALLYWRWTDELALRVFPVFPGKANTVEYTLTTPTSYADGTYYITYGRKPQAKNLAVPSMRIRHAKGLRIEVDGEAVESEFRLDSLKLHPVLRSLDIENPKTLVRSLTIKDVPVGAKLELHLNIEHTWRGDLEIALVSPDGILRDVQDSDLGDGGNNVKGRFEIDYDGNPNGNWHLLITDNHPLDSGALKEWELAFSSDRLRKQFRSAKPAFIPQPSDSQPGLATIGLTPAKAETQVRLGRVSLLQNKDFSRLEIDVAQRLSQLPRPLSVSFVIDVSHTMDTEGIKNQLRLIRAYLSHVPWATVSLTAYARDGVSLTKGFVPAAQLDKTLQRLKRQNLLEPKNGSFLDKGIEMAQLQQGKRPGQKALVLLTDNRLRPSWNNRESLAALGRLPKSTVVHVVDVQGDNTFSLTRDDTHQLYPLSKLREGIAVIVRGIDDAKPVELKEESLYLVRPNRLDHVELVGYQKDAHLDVADEDDESDSLFEGTGRRWMGKMVYAPPSVSIVGQLWSKPVRYPARANQEPFNKATAGFVFSHDLYSDLSDEEQFVVASYGKVVSPVTSYLAIEPGVRPSTIGLDDTFGVGGGSIGGAFGAGLGSIAKPPKIAWKTITDNAARACQRYGPGKVSLGLDLQSHEIADIDLRTSSSKTELDHCVIEEIWKVALPRHHDNPRTWSHELDVVVAQ